MQVVCAPKRFACKEVDDLHACEGGVTTKTEICPVVDLLSDLRRRVSQLVHMGFRCMHGRSLDCCKLRACLVLNKSPTYKLKSEISDLFCQTPPTYKSPLLISFKLVHPCLKLISHPFLHGAYTFNEFISHLQPNRHNL